MARVQRTTPPQEPAIKRVAKAAAVVGRTNLTIDVIVATSVQLMQKEGLGGLSMRQLAAELQVTPTALYHHVKDKDQLLELCAERILAEVATPDPQLRWPVRLRGLILSYQRTFLRFPGLAHYLLVQRESSLASLQWAESILAVLQDAGLGAQVATDVLMSMTFLINPITLIEDKVPAKGRQAVLYTTGVGAAVKKFPERFPALHACLPSLKRNSYEAYFERALDRVIFSIEQAVEAQTARVD